MTKKPTHLSARLDDQMRESLTILGAVEGMSQRDQVAWALKWAAHCLENAWAQGIVPLGLIPDMKANYRRPTPVTSPCDKRVTQVRAVIAQMQEREREEPEEPQEAPTEGPATAGTPSEKPASLSVSERVQKAVRELREAGLKVSGKTVAERAGIGESTAYRYLKHLA